MSLEKYLLLAHSQTALSALVAIVSFVKFKSRDTIIKLIGLVFLTSFIANISALALINIPAVRQYIDVCQYPLRYIRTIKLRFIVKGLSFDFAACGLKVVCNHCRYFNII